MIYSFMGQILQIVLPVFIILALGGLLKKLKLMDDAFIASSNKLIFNVCLPVLLFYKISKSNVSQVFNITHILIMILSVMAVFALSYLTSKIMNMKKNESGTFAMNNFRANYAYMGLPVSGYAFGDAGLVYASILMAFVVPYVNMMSVIALSISGGEGGNRKVLIKNTLLNPLSIACILGLVFSFFSINTPLIVEKSLSIISGVTLPLALFCVGAGMSIEKMKSDFFASAVSTSFKLIILPLCALLMLKFIGEELTMEAKVLIIMLSAPSATVNYVMASAMKGAPSLAASTIVMSTSLSLITFSVWLAFLGL